MMKYAAVLFLFSAFFILSGKEEGFSPEEMRKAMEFADPAFCRGALDSPARYSAQLRGGWEHVAEWVKNPSHPRHASAVRLFARIYDEVQTGLHWKIPVAEVSVPYLETPPDIDGTAGEREWADAVVFREEYLLNRTEPLKDVRSVWRVGWSGKNLYAAAEFRDPEVAAYRGRFDTPDETPLYLGDAFELFIRPDEKSLLYYEYLVNPESELWSLVHINDPRGSWIRICDDFPTGAKCAARRTADGYAVELSIPLAEQYGPWWNRGPRAGDRFRMMMVRTDRTGGAYTRTVPAPLLYEGHNIFGYMKAVLEPGKSKKD